MDYIKALCKIDPDNEITRSLFIDRMGDAGFESFVENESEIEAYIQVSLYREGMLEEEPFSGETLYRFSYSTERIADQNWNEVWEQNYFEPLLIDDQCVIRAPFHDEFPPAPLEIIINPRMAFGTGNHETTHLMIRSMLKQSIGGKTVLDMGCGSGILTILAKKRGAAQVTAIDIDEWSTNNTIENCRLNDIEGVDIRLGDAELLAVEPMRYDLILANIQRNVLLNDMPEYLGVMRPGSSLIMSGFYTHDLPSLRERAESLGLKFIGSDEINNWCSVIFLLPL